MENVESNNRMIAEFMGGDFSKSGDFVYFKLPVNRGFRLGNLKYHTSWDWLMLVVERIDTMGYNVEINRAYCHITRRESVAYFEYETWANSRIEAIYTSIIAFIKWHNSIDTPPSPCSLNH